MSFSIDSHVIVMMVHNPSNIVLWYTTQVARRSQCCTFFVSANVEAFILDGILICIVDSCPIWFTITRGLSPSPQALHPASRGWSLSSWSPRNLSSEDHIVVQSCQSWIATVPWLVQEEHRYQKQEPKDVQTPVIAWPAALVEYQAAYTRSSIISASTLWPVKAHIPLQ